MQNLCVWSHGNYCEESDMNEDVVCEFGSNYKILNSETTFEEISKMDAGFHVALSDYFKYK